MKNNRLCIAAALVLALTFSLTGCMNANTRDTGVAPTAAPDYMPGTTQGAVGPTSTVNPTAPVNDGNTSGTANGALAPFDWANGASEIESAITRISEIAECRVVVVDSTALAAVRFDNVYKGQLTERIREMVAAEVMKADPSIQTVAVTSDSGDVKKVYQIADQIRAGRTPNELSGEIHAIVRNATTMR